MATHPTPPPDLPPQAPVIAIDGPAGAGKSTLAKALAQRYGWRLVDTGAMYRALTWWALQQQVQDPAALADLARRLPLSLGTDPVDQSVSVDGVDVTAAIRSPEVTAAVSAVSAIPEVRHVMVERQRELARGGGVVMEGRDIGTTVLPDAALKVFLTASAAERAARRSGQTGEPPASVADALARRDQADSSRETSPLAAAPDAVVIDSSRLTLEEVLAAVDAELRRRVQLPDPAVEHRPAPAAGSRLPPSPPPGRWPRLLLACRWLARHLVRAVLRVRIVGEERIPAGPVLLAGNHTGFLDGPLVFILLRRPACFLAKAELFDGCWAPLLRWVRQIPVHRGTPDRQALGSALSALADGEIVGMFPEGTRGEGKLETIRHGVGYLAAQSGCPVVPVVCRGTAEALPKGKVLPRWRTRVEIVIGVPFRVSPRPPLRRADMAQAAHEIVARLRELVEQSGPTDRA